MRILLVGDPFEPKTDGVAVFGTQAIKHLRAMGHEVRIVTSVRDAPLHGARVYCLPGIRPAIYPSHSLTLPSLRLFAILWEYHPHVVHLLDESFLGCGMQVVCTLMGVPTVWSHHTRAELYDFLWPQLWALGLQHLFFYTLRRLFASQSNAHLAVCTALHQQLLDAKCHDVTMWHSGCDVDRFHPRHRQAGMHEGSLRHVVTGGAPHVPIVLCVGRLTHEKNVQLLPAVVDALNGDKGEHLVAHFVIVGDGPLGEQLRATMAGKAATFVGYLPPGGDQLTAMYASADAFFSPSVTEAFALVFLEAMASGLPVVGAAAGGVPEAFTPGEHGFLFDPTGPHAARSAADAITKALHLAQLPHHTERRVHVLPEHGAPAKPHRYSDVLCNVPPHHLHVREKARLHAESLSWRRTYEEAVVAYRRARGETTPTDPGIQLPG